MSQFVVSARKYRPANFKDVISQPHITTTLQNAIACKQLAHAFLFCGPRGVGKTTCARILAKATNCLQITEEIEPCNCCINCLSFNTNSSMNVYELDAASNNSVEDIRNLVDQLRYAPQMGQYKIYIIDEVHMLSNAAFNAFLKTLEEPPNYAIFILATTERQKVLPTIVSRCQIFNFNRIKLEDIITQLEKIAIQESISYEISALQLIGQKAEGAMRDALSMFDLVNTSTRTGGTITYAVTCDHLQFLDYDYYFKCTEAFLKGDIPAVLAIYDAILRAGFHGHHFVVGLGEHLRNLLVCKDNATIPLLEVTDHIRPHYAECASRCTVPFLLHGLTLLNQCDIHYKSSQHQRLHVELVLIELASSNSSATASPTDIAEVVNVPNQTKNKKGLAKTKSVDYPSLQSSTIVNTIKTVDHSTKDDIATKVQVATPLPSRKHKQETLVIPTLAQLKCALISKENASKPLEIGRKGNIESPIMEKTVQSFLVDYREQLRKDGNVAGYHLLNQPIQVKDQIITITLLNPVQEDTLQNLKEALLSQLRTKLNHPDITIQGIFIPKDQNKKPYTDQEKLTFLSKKNTAIALLQEHLALEVAY